MPCCTRTSVVVLLYCGSITIPRVCISPSSPANYLPTVAHHAPLTPPSRKEGAGLVRSRCVTNSCLTSARKSSCSMSGPSIAGRVMCCLVLAICAFRNLANTFSKKTTTTCSNKCNKGAWKKTGVKDEPSSSLALLIWTKTNLIHPDLMLVPAWPRLFTPRYLLPPALDCCYIYSQK